MVGPSEQQRPTVDPGSWRFAVSLKLRHAIGLTEDPAPMCMDPDVAYFPVDGVARVVHGDLATMIIGGLGSIFFQMLHPLAMAGVAQHSRYQHDATGRLLQTANFIGFTTYGTATTAALAIERVRAVHEAVQGVADDGRPYAANDPHLLAWVHACEASMFLAAYQRYGRDPLTGRDCDAYVGEMARVAEDLGASDVPHDYAQLWEQLEGFRAELRLTDDGRDARQWLQQGYVKGWHQQAAHRLFVQASYDLLPVWARQRLEVPVATKRHQLLTRPLSQLLCASVRTIVPPVDRVDLSRPTVL